MKQMQKIVSSQARVDLENDAYKTWERVALFNC